jgi:hypothetical protein
MARVAASVRGPRRAGLQARTECRPGQVASTGRSASRQPLLLAISRTTTTLPSRFLARAAPLLMRATRDVGQISARTSTALSRFAGAPLPSSSNRASPMSRSRCRASLLRQRRIKRSSGRGIPPRQVVPFGFLEKVDPSKVDEIGFADLMPGSGHGPGGWVDVAQIEVYARAVPRSSASQ